MNFMPKLYSKRRSLDSRGTNQTPTKANSQRNNINETSNNQQSPQRTAGERLYEQGRQLLILKEEFSKMQQQ